MTDTEKSFRLGRRGFLASSVAMSTVAPLAEQAFGAGAAVIHQPGILTPQQPFAYFITFDVATTTRREELASLLRKWTEAADA